MAMGCQDIGIRKSECVAKTSFLFDNNLPRMNQDPIIPKFVYSASQVKRMQKIRFQQGCFFFYFIKFKFSNHFNFAN